VKEDRISILAVIVGATLAFIGWRQWILLSSGIGMALGGVVLALRGQRPVQARGWLRAALLLGAIAIVMSLMLDLYADWVAAQWFAEGSQPGNTAQELRLIARTSAGMRSAGLFLSLAFLLGALANRFGGDAKKPDEKKHEDEPTRDLRK